MGLENRAVPREEIGPRVMGALEASGVAHLAERRVSTLSGGEQQRVALAAATVGRPRVILLDEPTAMLDPAAAVTTSRLLADLPDRPSQVMVEHRLEDVGSIPERMVVLDRDGKVTVDGPTGEVLSRHGPDLLSAGVWLPLASELGLLTGDRERDPLLPTEEVLSDGDLTAALREMAAIVPEVRPIVGAEPVLTMATASFAYDDRAVFREVDLEVRPGEVVALVGVNGSGKTTLLLGAAGLHQPSQGFVDAAPAALVFQRPDHQFIGRSVAEDLTLGLTHLPDEKRKTIGTETLISAGLEKVAHLDPHRLSGGQKRKLSVLAMTVLGRPLLLLDEPTFGLDRTDTAATARRVVNTARKGAAVVLATHDLRFASMVADRIAVLADEGLLSCGPAETIMSDRGLLADAGLVQPPLVDWWTRQEGIGLRPLLSSLYMTTVPTPT
ncbi:MAG: ATP-binding cassette domain-containing protein [Acidimicrobiia bacterium]|nr:ATP-binding cassette domain-containing protein [Acidimicrobiia bacterium]